jgi:hypothetical protein
MIRLQLPYNSCATLTFFFLRSTIEYIGHTYKKTDPILISLKKKIVGVAQELYNNYFSNVIEYYYYYSQKEND